MERIFLEPAALTSVQARKIHAGSWQDACQAGIPADEAANYTLNGYSDWFLPSREELNQYLINESLLPQLDANIYWTSSELSSFSVWTIDFLNGGVGIVGKGDVFLQGGLGSVGTRAIRAF